MQYQNIYTLVTKGTEAIGLCVPISDTQSNVFNVVQGATQTVLGVTIVISDTVRSITFKT